MRRSLSPRAIRDLFVHHAQQLGGVTRREAPTAGLRPTVRFAVASALTLAWVAFSVWVSGPWRDELEAAIGPVMGWVIPIFLAYIPGLVIGFMIFTLLITRYQELPLEPPRGDWPDGEWPSVTILVAAWNESEAIVRTLERIAELSYAGRVEVVVADNNSTDDTALLADAAGARLGLHYRRVFEAKQGKHHALNAALATVTTPLVVTVDADTHLQPQSVTRLVVRLTSTPQGQHVCACAAALVAENPLATFVTRMQQWDYRLGINGVKRMQAAYNTALVAQGAFSGYWTSDLRAVGGWPDAIGEDIVLTWTMLGVSRDSCSTSRSRSASPSSRVRLGRLLSQRSRWARGMLEGLRTHPPPKQPRVLAKLVAGIDYLVPLLDIGVIFFWVPGVILFLFGYPLIFGWWSMLLLPITLAVFGFMQRWQARHVFRTLEHPPAARQARLPRLPVRLPGAHLRSRTTRLRPVHRRVESPLEVETGSCFVQLGDAARAAATASSRELTPRARKRPRTWFLTVSLLRWSSAAICFVERPCSRRRSTSTWRGVRCGGAVGVSSGRPSNSPKTPTTRSPFMSGAELISTATRVPAVETRTPVASVAGEVPSTFRENSSRARRLSSGATTEVKWRPQTSPTSRSAAGLIQRTTPVVSRT